MKMHNNLKNPLVGKKLEDITKEGNALRNKVHAQAGMKELKNPLTGNKKK